MTRIFQHRNRVTNHVLNPDKHNSKRWPELDHLRQFLGSRQVYQIILHFTRRINHSSGPLISENSTVHQLTSLICVLPFKMAASQPYFTAAVIFDYAWSVDETSTKTSTWTSTYTDTPGDHTAYAILALSSSLQLETVGIPYSIAPSKSLYTQTVRATAATHSPMTSVLHSDPSVVATVTATAMPCLSEPPKADDRSFLRGPVAVYLHIVLLCIFFGGCLLFRLKRSRRRQDAGFELVRMDKTGV